MILRIDHVSLAVKDYEKAFAFFTKILGAIPQTHGRDKELKYYWEILSLGDLSRLELLTPTEKDTFLKNFLQKKEGGIHHITLQTSNIEQAKNFLEKNHIPYFRFRDYGEGWKELFLHPKDAFGVLLQIAEFNPQDWLNRKYKLPEGKKWVISKKHENYQIIFAHPGGGKVKLDLNQKEIKNLIHDLQTMIES
jgi:methylmalonyl-CoA/ethylmalonyl-CoA epimerase